MLEYVKRQDIDDERWDQTVSSSSQFRHYALTHYLDNASEAWDAIIAEDYAWVWPLPFKTSMIKWVYQPLLCQQLGPIGHMPNEQALEDAIGIIKKHFSGWLVKFNDHYNALPFDRVVLHKNISLNLGSTYEQISEGYNRNIVSNLKKYERSEAAIDIRTTYEPWAVEAFKKTKGQAIEELDEAFYSQVRDIDSAFEQLGQAQTYSLRLNDIIIAQVLLLTAERRSLLFFSHADKQARLMGGMHALIDQAIQDHAGIKGAVLDFEGSDNDNLAYFYRSFGGEEHVYLQAESKSVLHAIKDRLKR